MVGGFSIHDVSMIPLYEYFGRSSILLLLSGFLSAAPSTFCVSVGFVGSGMVRLVAVLLGLNVVVVAIGVGRLFTPFYSIIYSSSNTNAAQDDHTGNEHFKP